MISLLFGLASAALGLSGLWIWRAEFLQFLKGVLPVSLLFAGVVAVLAGLSGVIAKHQAPKQDNGKD